MKSTIDENDIYNEANNEKELLEEQIDNLTKELHNALSELRDSKFEIENSENELFSLKEQLNATNKLKQELTAALEHEQYQRHNLLSMIRTRQSDSYENKSESFSNSNLQKEADQLRRQIVSHINFERSVYKQIISLKECLLNLDSRLEYCDHKDYIHLLPPEQKSISIESIQPESQPASFPVQTKSFPLDVEPETDVMLMNIIRIEIGHLYDYVRSFNNWRRKSQKHILEEKDDEITRLKAKCKYVSDSLKEKDSKILAQKALLVSLDTSLDRLITN